MTEAEFDAIETRWLALYAEGVEAWNRWVVAQDAEKDAARVVNETRAATKEARHRCSRASQENMATRGEAMSPEASAFADLRAAMGVCRDYAEEVRVITEASDMAQRHAEATAYDLARQKHITAEAVAYAHQMWVAWMAVRKP